MRASVGDRIVTASGVVGGAVRLFNRGNGAPAGPLLPLNASCDLDLGAFLAYLDGRGESPEPERIVEWVEEAYRETDRIMRELNCRG